MPSTDQAVRSSIEDVDDAVGKLRIDYRRAGFQGIHTGAVPFGRFGNLVGSEVTAEQRIDVGNTGEYVSVRHTFVVTCTGFGCTDPVAEVATRNLIFDCDHGDITEEGRLAARKQAQAHAETCRALPHTTA
jgi:hypothetical protein